MVISKSKIIPLKWILPAFKRTVLVQKLYPNLQQLPVKVITTKEGKTSYKEENVTLIPFLSLQWTESYQKSYKGNERGHFISLQVSRGYLQHILKKYYDERFLCCIFFH